jgi:endonuclease G
MRLSSFLIAFLFLSPFHGISQSVSEKIASTEKRIASLEDQKKLLLLERENLKLEKIRADLTEIGLPPLANGDQLIWHKAMALAYAETYEQPRWVAHIILPDITVGVLSRSNDFRPDSLVTTGSATEADYFLKYLKSDSTYKYDGFGYDRGHLAPSADFRWSAQALSESFLYSNMSPQVDSFNRGIWGDLEDKIREYVYKHPGSSLYVVTGPVLQPGLPKIERGINKVAIPKLFWKVVLDKEKKAGIAFIIPNAAGYKPLETYSVTIDSVQRLTGLTFFPKLPADEAAVIKSQRVNAVWFAEVASGDVEPVPIYELRRGQVNTTIAGNLIGSSKAITVVGKVVGGRSSKAGNVLLYIDKQYPNETFTLFIRKEDVSNFSYDIIPALKGKRIAATGKINALGDKPVMYVSSDKEVEAE